MIITSILIFIFPLDKFSVFQLLYHSVQPYEKPLKIILTWRHPAWFGWIQTWNVGMSMSIIIMCRTFPQVFIEHRSCEKSFLPNILHTTIYSAFVVHIISLMGIFASFFKYFSAFSSSADFSKQSNWSAFFAQHWLFFFPRLRITLECATYAGTFASYL